MDYEKKYKEALEKARQLCVYPTTKPFISDLQDLFPELKESGDERIRKFLHHTFTVQYLAEDELGKWHGEPVSNILAWLEKQGEPVEINPTEFDTRLQSLIGKFDSLPKEELIGSLSFWLNVVQNDGTYKKEKQGEVPVTINIDKMVEDYANNEECDNEGFGKPVNCMIRAYRQGLTDAIVILNLRKQGEQNLIMAKSPHLGEQKPDDNTEPKFHEGDWVIDKQGIVHQISNVIENVTNHTYVYEIVGGGYFGDNIEGVRLWTIADAKDGDVLVDNLGNVCIYQEPSTKLMYHSYCYGNHKCFIDMGGSHEIAGSYPATKEQSDALMKAMYDAGWEFDFEKKKLKKIENEIEIPFGAKDSELQEATYFIPKGFHAEIDDDKVVIKKGEKLTAWSKEDALRLEEVICMIEANGRWVRSDDAVKLNVDWLKTLKDRVGCEANRTTTKEWSEDDEQHIDSLLKRLDGLCRNEFERTRFAISEDRDWLKSLKARYTWKPSDEQMEAIRVAGEIGTTECPWTKGFLKEIYEQLKKLREK